MEKIEEGKLQGKSFEYWLKKNWYYHKCVKNFYRFVVPKGVTVLHINSKNGYLLEAIKPCCGVGVDEDEHVILAARKKYPKYQFYASLKDVPGDKAFDYIILSFVTMETYDIQELLTDLHRFCHARTRIVIESYSYLWEPILWLTQKLGLRRSTVFNNWISDYDFKNFLYIAGFDNVTQGRYLLLPVYIPFISTLCNVLLANLPFIKRFCLLKWMVVRPIFESIKPDYVSVSVIIPCKNEQGTIEQAVFRCPQMGKKTELIFVEGNSSDNTLLEIKHVMQKYPEKNIRYYVQEGCGKYDAVQKGLAHAHGDILMILDSDLTVVPEELQKFFEILIKRKGEFINGSRFVYSMEPGAMRFLGLCANFFFSFLFSWILGQRIKDTLCGTKVLWKSDYRKILHNRLSFNKYDPFGDFDLLFGAAKLYLKIVDMPVHYKKRIYGFPQVRHFRDVWLLVWISFLVLKRYKLRS